MAKRNKKMRSNRSAFKLEALEQRQLLATIVGGTGGSEVGSNIVVSGKTYDQILMTGSSVSVQADAGQIVRVDFLDADGDITRAEFSGSGTLNISLANFADAATPAKYSNVSNKYVSGLASFTFTGSDGTTNFNVYSLGTGNAFNGAANPIFADPAKQGGNHFANVSRLVIVGDPANPVSGSGSGFGSVTAGNAIFGDSSGVVGLYAPNTSFKSGSSIIIGDIVPTGTATPTIQLGAFSDVKTVTIAGGSLTSASGGNGFIFSNVTRMTSGPGTDSAGTKIDTKTLSSSSGTVTYSSGLGAITIDGATATQATLDAYKGSYLSDVTVTGGLSAGLVFRALQFGNVTVSGNLAGIITTDVNDNNSSDGNEQGIGNVSVSGNVVDGGYIESATSIGNVSISGTTTHTAISGLITVGGLPQANQQAIISTLGRGGQSASIGGVTFGGDVNLTAAEGLIVSGLKSLSTNGLTSTTTAGSTAGGIGSISGVNLTANTGAAVIPIIGNFATGGNIGNINFSGDVSLTNTDATTIVSSSTPSTGSDAIFSARNIGNITAKSLTINDAGNAIRAQNVNQTSTSVGSIGNISTTNGSLTIAKGNIIATGSIGNFSVGGSGSLLLQGNGGTANVQAQNGSIGSLSVASGNLTTSATATILSGSATGGGGGLGDISITAGDLSIGSVITVTGGNVGNIVLTNSTGGSTIGAAITANAFSGVGGAIGNTTVTAGNLTVNAALSAATNIGNVSLGNGTLTFGAAGAYKAVTAATGAIGNITVGGTIVGNTGIEFDANSVGNVSVTGRLADATLLTDVNVRAKGTTQATQATAKIGDITLNSTANNSGDIATSTAASTTNATGTSFSSSGNIGNVTITTGTAAGAEIVTGAAGALVIRAGNSEAGAVANTTASGAAVNIANGAATTDNVESVSIGNVSITGNISTGSNLSKGNAAGTGLIIASGVKVTTAGGFRDVGGVAATNPAVFPAALTSGNIGALTISDVSGGVVKTPFSNANLGVVTATDNGGSVIIADKIASITVNSGPGAILSLPSLSGLPLKGALGDATFVPNTSNQEFVGSATALNGLVIVVL